MDTVARAHALAPDLVELRRDLHRHPELSNREVRTSRLVAKRLQQLGYQVQSGVGGTGVVGELRTGSGPTVALRADMDALPIQEESDVPYASTVPGVMHACGHDAHTAALLGAASILAGQAQEDSHWTGKVRLLFQPCEESVDGNGKTGAQRMVEAGVLDGAHAVLAIHVGAHLDPGRVYVSSGPVFAGSDTFSLEVAGQSAHGARPHEGVDAVVLAAQVVTAAQQTVARRLDPRAGAVLGFGTVQGGRAPNVLADRVNLEGTLRYFTPEDRRGLRAGLEGALRTVESMEGRGSVRYSPGPPPLVNHARVVDVVRSALTQALGDEAVVPAEPTTMAEDFAYFAEATPGALLWVGAGLEDRREHHHPRFDVDEACLPVAAITLAEGARALLRTTPFE